MPPNVDSASADAAPGTSGDQGATPASVPASPEATPASVPEGEVTTVAETAAPVNAAEATGGQVSIEGVDDGEAEPPKRKRGRPSKADLAARLNGTTPAPPRPVAPAPAALATLPPMHNYDAVAEQAANLWFNIPQLALGTEWEPEGNEPQIVKGAFKNYFQANNIGSIPPEWGLALTLISYTAKRLTKPTIKNRVFGAWEWLKSKAKFGR